MYYLVYRITNTINGKTYIGAHATVDKDDGYMGSGLALRFAIKKYGREAFIRDILHEGSSAEAMYAKEKELVIPGPENYNLIAGGSGTFRSPRGPFTEEHKRKLRESRLGRRMSDETRKKISQKLLGLKRGPQNLQIIANRSAVLSGRKLSKEHIAKRSASVLGTKRGPYRKRKGEVIYARP